MSILRAESSRHWVRSIRKKYENFPFLHGIILKQNYIAIFTSRSLVNINYIEDIRIILDYINVFLDNQCIVISQKDFYYKILKWSSFKDTHSKKWPSNETLVLTKSTNTGIWVAGWYNKSTLYKRFFNWKKIFKKTK